MNGGLSSGFVQSVTGSGRPHFFTNSEKRICLATGADLGCAAFRMSDKQVVEVVLEVSFIPGNGFYVSTQPCELTKAAAKGDNFYQNARFRHEPIQEHFVLHGPNLCKQQG